VNGQDEDAKFATEQAVRLARIRARIREGVWALRDNSALQAHWEALECEEVMGDAVQDEDKIGATPILLPR